MKKLLLLLILFSMLDEKSQAQVVYSPNTYYIIPPTVGCNGIWAVEYPQNCFAVSSILTPFGCATVNHFDGDTLFFDLCSVPCEYVVINDSGNICMTCWLQPPTGITESAGGRENIIISPNPAGDLINVNGNILKDDVFMLINSFGQEMAGKHFDCASKTNEIKVKDLPGGIYFWKIFSMNEVRASGKIIVIK